MSFWFLNGHCPPLKVIICVVENHKSISCVRPDIIQIKISFFFFLFHSLISLYLCLLIRITLSFTLIIKYVQILFKYFLNATQILTKYCAIIVVKVFLLILSNILQMIFQVFVKTQTEPQRTQLSWV